MLTVLLVLELSAMFIAAPLAAKGLPMARAVVETLVLAVPRARMEGGIGFITDSPLEESGFELTVPSDRSVSNQGRQPLCNARRFGAGTGTETSKGK
jgi:hypothetical protein